MITRCLCCGREVSAPGSPASNDHRFLSLIALLRHGFTIDDMTSKPEQISSHEFTSPGFVAWLRTDPIARMLELEVITSAGLRGKPARSDPPPRHVADFPTSIETEPPPF
jgi:hypothetical protein